MISKKENILFSAEKIFAERGFEGTSTREIAKKANVNISMISYYFGSKEKLFEKIFEYRMNESLSFSKDILANNNLNEWEKINVVIDRYTERITKLQTFYLIMQREQLTNKNPHINKFIDQSRIGFLNTYNLLINSGFEKKIFTKKPRVEFLHATVSGTLFTALNKLPVYKDFIGGDDQYENNYLEDINNHIKDVLKYLLGYEKNI